MVRLEMVTVVSGLVGGITLGLRFKVFILIPTVSAATCLIGVAAIVVNYSVWSELWAMVEASLALQTGYLVGLSGADIAARTLSRRHAYSGAAADL
jgi:urea transporter